MNHSYSNKPVLFNLDCFKKLIDSKIMKIISNNLGQVNNKFYILIKQKSIFKNIEILLSQNILSILMELNKFLPFTKVKNKAKLINKKLTLSIQQSNLNIAYLLIFVSKMSLLFRSKSLLSQKKILNPLRKSIILITINMRLISLKLKFIDKDFIIKLIKTSLIGKLSQNHNFISNSLKLIDFIINRIKYYKNKTNIKNIFRNVFFSKYKNWYSHNSFFISKGLLFQKYSNHINFKRTSKSNPSIIIIPTSLINKKDSKFKDSSIKYCNKYKINQKETRYQFILQTIKNTNADLILLDQKDTIITDLMNKYTKSTIINNFYSSELFNIINNLGFEKNKSSYFYHNFNSSKYFRLNICNSNFISWLLITNKSTKRRCLSIICTFTDYQFEKDLLNDTRNLIVLIIQILIDGRVLPSDNSVEFLITKMIKYKIQLTELRDIIVKSFYYLIYIMNHKKKVISFPNNNSILKINFERDKTIDLRNLKDHHKNINYIHLNYKVCST